MDFLLAKRVFYLYQELLFCEREEFLLCERSFISDKAGTLQLKTVFAKRKSVGYVLCSGEERRLAKIMCTK